MLATTPVKSTNAPRRIMDEAYLSAAAERKEAAKSCSRPPHPLKSKIEHARPHWSSPCSGPRGGLWSVAAAGVSGHGWKQRRFARRGLPDAGDDAPEDISVQRRVAPAGL